MSVNDAGLVIEITLITVVLRDISNSTCAAAQIAAQDAQRHKGPVSHDVSQGQFPPHFIPPPDNGATSSPCCKNISGDMMEAMARNNSVKITVFIVQLTQE